MLFSCLISTFGVTWHVQTINRVNDVLVKLSSEPPTCPYGQPYLKYPGQDANSLPSHLLMDVTEHI